MRKTVIGALLFVVPASVSWAQDAETSDETAAVETPVMPAPPPEGADNAATGGGFFPFFRVGPSVDVSLLHPLNVNIDATILKMFGVGISFGVFPELEIGEVKVGIANWDVRGRWFPFSGSFFVGAAMGQHTIGATTSASYNVTVAGTTVAVPTEIAFEVKATTLTPHLGWFATWDSGFTLGTEFGVLVPTGAESSLEVTASGPYANQLDAVKQTSDYLEAKKDAEDLGDQIGKQTLPYWNVLRLGWMF